MASRPSVCRGPATGRTREKQVVTTHISTNTIASRARSEVADIVSRLRLLIVVGISVGVIIAGFGSRLAMMLLRLTSPATVRGVTSDDGFKIGEVTIGGTYNLLVIGAMVGILGVAAYLAVAPWLLGPRWFRHFTVAAACGAVVGSMLVHADGIDFVLLKPTWFAIGLFVALPAVFGAGIAAAVDRAIAHEQEAAMSGSQRSAPQEWLTPIVLVLLFPPTLVLVGAAALVLAVWVPLRNSSDSFSVPRPIGVLIRAVWFAIAFAGLLVLIGDVRAIV